MKKLNILLLTLLFSATSLAGNWASPIDSEYQKRNSKLYVKFEAARAILDSWRGEKSKLREAYGVLNEIVESDEEYAPAYMQYGRLFIMSGYINSNKSSDGKLGTAESSIEHAIKLSPQYADAYVLLGHLYTAQKEFLKAKNALVMAQEIGTESPWLNNNWADYYSKVGNDKSAIEHYELVIESKTNNRKAMSAAIGALARIYSSNNMKDKTLALYEKTVEFEPESAWAWGNYATILLFKFGEVDEAIKKGEKAISIMNYGLGRLTLASAYCTKWAQNKRKNPELAQEYLNKALSYVSDIDAIIQETSQYGHTRFCSMALRDHKNS